MIKTIYRKIKSNPLMYSFISAIILGLVLMIPYQVISNINYIRAYKFNDYLIALVIDILIGVFVIYPIILTIINFVMLFIKKQSDAGKKVAKRFEYITVVLGSIYSMLVTAFLEIQWNADWIKQLVNSQLHAPIYTKNLLTIIVLSAIGIGGYLLLSFVPLNMMPPLVIVSSISAMYLGIIQCAIWSIQVSSNAIVLAIFPVNCILIALKTIRYKIEEWNALKKTSEKIYKHSILNFCNKMLNDAKKWPLIAFILMIPLLGGIIMILALFGQQPDACIKAWTETSDWTLSRQVSPQNIFYDEHYLCTVAAGGHRKVVKPIRMGERHGHAVVVNRQLCIANAFEQIIEEKTPKFHRAVRGFYDSYGFPIAKLIHSPYIADFVYFIMKPLEWIFIVVLYFTDVNPENRIAVQYFPLSAEMKEKLIQSL